VVVGHSLGGVVITQAVEYEPQSFAKLVYVLRVPAAERTIPRLGGLAQTDVGLVTPNRRRDIPKGYVSFPEDAPLREIFYHDGSEEDARRAAAMLVPGRWRRRQRWSA
jgi:pimeloyl-ACP methyl ester carboxylesterase